MAALSFTSLSPPSSPPLNLIASSILTTAQTFNTQHRRTRRRSWFQRTRVRNSSSENPSVTVTSPLSFGGDGGKEVSASEIVRNFYRGINGRDLSSVEELIAENCVYEDLVLPRPFVGRKAILEFFQKFNDSIIPDLQFVIDDISAEDSLAIGVTWHLELKGRPFPFSKGCSFYRLEVVNGKRQIIYGRDNVEPAFKPGEAALVVISGVTWLLQRFPQLADQF